jgi:hypothetical protein
VTSTATAAAVVKGYQASVGELHTRGMTGHLQRQVHMAQVGIFEAHIDN